MNERAEPVVRTVIVDGPSAWRESGRVLQGAFHIVLWSGLFVFSHAEASGGEVAVAPHERRFSDLDAADQRTFRAVSEGVTEAQRAREWSGRWPDAASLADRLVPPFADDPLDTAGRQWRSFFDAETRLINYVGVPTKGGDASTWIVIVSEPEPGTVADVTDVGDDRHQKLADGTLVHVGVWFGPRLGDLEPPVAFVNPELGWRRVVVRPSP